MIDQYRLQRYIGRILSDGNRVSFCCTKAGFGSQSVRVCAKDCDNGTAVILHGVAYCSSIWTCPVCGRILRRRRAERTTDIFRRTMAMGYRLLFVTYTLSHTRDISASEMLERQRKAWRSFTNSRTYRDVIKRFGTGWAMRALEITYSNSSGWHPHYHAVYAVASHVSDDVAKELYYAWAAAVLGTGSDALPQGFNAEYVADPDKVADYVSSWGGGDFKLGYEVSGIKLGRRGSRSPFQLAADALDGCDASKMAFIEYADAIRGSRAQTWSRNWRAAFDLLDDDVKEDTISSADLIEKDAVITLVLHTYEYERLGRRRDDFIDCVARRDLSGVYDIFDVLGISAVLVNVPWWLDGKGGGIVESTSYGRAAAWYGLDADGLLPSVGSRATGINIP